MKKPSKGWTLEEWDEFKQWSDRSFFAFYFSDQYWDVNDYLIPGSFPTRDAVRRKWFQSLIVSRDSKNA